MRYKELKKLNKKIARTAKAGSEALPVIINELRPSQKYLIVSLDPSSDTDKSKDSLDKHSGFEERVISLVFFGSDDLDCLQKIRMNYRKYKNKFLNNFYWTNFSKCYSAGDPDTFWADRFLKKEINLFEPQLMIIFGAKVSNFLFGRGELKNRVNKVLKWENIPTIYCLHPSRDWNIRLRSEYAFYETWTLIRSKVKLI
jgi:uracil-DNA glycosylase